METEGSEVRPRLSERTVSNIKILYDIARSNGASLSVKDLLLLTSMDLTEDQLYRAWQETPFLSSHYAISAGVIIEISSMEDKHHLENEKREITERYLRATSNVTYAERFGAFIGKRLFKVLSISGSTSYFSVSKDDDLDFFCITQTGRMWASFVKALVLARIFRLSVEDSPWLCLSYVADERFAQFEFSENRDALFARDAISARVITGDQNYENLLKENSWMAQYFPKLYALRIKSLMKANSPSGINASVASRFANLFLYYIAGSYIRLKSHLLNRRFMKNQKRSSLFRLRIGPDHCIYESADYVRLKGLYTGLQKAEAIQSRPLSR
jgi:hypothetical protein